MRVLYSPEKSLAAGSPRFWTGKDWDPLQYAVVYTEEEVQAYQKLMVPMGLNIFFLPLPELPMPEVPPQYDKNEVIELLEEVDRFFRNTIAEHDGRHMPVIGNVRAMLEALR